MTIIARTARTASANTHAYIVPVVREIVRKQPL
jgi:hypothetical protein